jgi:DNA-binding PadR family transcriptional regulator
MSSVRLTPTSYVVLGLIEKFQPVTPYDIKQLTQLSVVNFWSLPHTQLYSECARLAEAGLLDETREESGRRRKVYRLTKEGLKALDEWRSDTEALLYEIRDLGTLKLFFGADPKKLAPGQLEAYEEKLREFEQLHRDVPDMPEGMRLALEAGIGHVKEYVRFWKRMQDA